MIVPQNYPVAGLPGHWRWVALKDVTARPTSIDPRKTPDRNYRYIDISAIDNSRSVVKAARDVTGKDAPTRARQIVRSGDILYSTVRVYLKNLARVQVELDGALASTGFCVLRATDLVDPGYLFYWVQAAAFTRTAAALQRGISYPAINESELLNIALPLAPLDEQQRISFVVDSQIGRVESAVDDVQRAIAKADALERSVLVHAMREASTAAVSTIRLGEISEVRLGRQRSPKNHAGKHMKPYLRAANIGWTGLLLQDVKQMNFAEREQNTYRLMSGDIILSEASGSRNEVGKPAIWLGELTDCYFQNTLIRVRAKADVEPRYLLAFFRMLARSGAFARASRGVGIHHLGAQTLAAWEVPLPSAAYQRRLVARLDEALLTVARLQGELRLTLARATTLRNAILNAAFTGRLPVGIATSHDGLMAQASQLAGLTL